MPPRKHSPHHVVIEENNLDTDPETNPDEYDNCRETHHGRRFDLTGLARQ